MGKGNSVLNLLFQHTHVSTGLPENLSSVGHSRCVETFAPERLASSSQGPLPVLVCTPVPHPFLHGSVPGAEDSLAAAAGAPQGPEATVGPVWGMGSGQWEPGTGREQKRC